jgi:hypothetical protein
MRRMKRTLPVLLALGLLLPSTASATCASHSGYQVLNAKIGLTKVTIHNGEHNSSFIFHGANEETCVPAKETESHEYHEGYNTTFKTYTEGTQTEEGDLEEYVPGSGEVTIPATLEMKGEYGSGGLTGTVSSGGYNEYNERTHETEKESATWNQTWEMKIKLHYEGETCQTSWFTADLKGPKGEDGGRGEGVAAPDRYGFFTQNGSHDEFTGGSNHGLLAIVTRPEISNFHYCELGLLISYYAGLPTSNNQWEVEDEITASLPLRPFSPQSPWNTPIPTNGLTFSGNEENIKPSIDHLGYVEWGGFSDPVWAGMESDPLDSVKCTGHDEERACQLEEQPIHIPEDAKPAGGTDGAMVVTNGETEYDFFEARHEETWKATWGKSFSLTGEGAGYAGIAATGSGLPIMGGLPLLTEFEAGQINHALAFFTVDTCKETAIYPASESDGTHTEDSCIPEGTRIQLNPAKDLEAIPGITKGELIIGRALQKYGAYCKDSGGERGEVAISLQAPDGKPDPYPALFVGGEGGKPMPNIPWGELRILANWER